MKIVRWVLLAPAVLAGGYLMTVMCRVGVMLAGTAWVFGSMVPYLNAIAEGLGVLIGAVLAAWWVAPDRKEIVVRVLCGGLALYTGLVGAGAWIAQDWVQLITLGIICTGAAMRALTNASMMPS